MPRWRGPARLARCASATSLSTQGRRSTPGGAQGSPRLLPPDHRLPGHRTQMPADARCVHAAGNAGLPCPPAPLESPGKLATRAACRNSHRQRTDTGPARVAHRSPGQHAHAQFPAQDLAHPPAAALGEPTSPPRPATYCRSTKQRQDEKGSVCCRRWRPVGEDVSARRPPRRIGTPRPVEMPPIQGRTRRLPREASRVHWRIARGPAIFGAARREACRCREHCRAHRVKACLELSAALSRKGTVWHGTSRPPRSMPPGLPP